MKKKTGIDLISEHREERIKEGRTIKEDVSVNPRMELRKGAIALICKSDGTGTAEAFPSAWKNDVIMKMIHKSYKDRLVIAGAMIASEIDRLIATEE